MPLQTIVLAALVAAFGCAQYVLAFHAMRDLIRRPRVRGGNKVSWGLVILCLPVAGALIYGWMGPASFIRRAPAGTGPVTGTTVTPIREAGAPRGMPRPQPNVTPIRHLHPPATPKRASTPRSSIAGRIRRTGS